MYQQKCEPKKYSAIQTLLLTAAGILIFLFFCFLLAYIDRLFGASGASFAALFLFLLLGYFLIKPNQASYLYTLKGNCFTIEQIVNKKTVKTIRIEKNTITSVVPGRSGYRLLPRGHAPYTIFCSDKQYCVALDDTMRAGLLEKSATDAFLMQNREKIFNTLQELISVPSVKSAPQNGMPFGPACAQVLEKTLAICESLGMKTKNLENYCGWAEIGSGKKMIGILCHLDVGPAGDGWITNPFEAVFSEGCIIGRGAADDKGPTAAAIYAVAAVKESLESLPGRIRLIFGCDEESGWGCMERYGKTEELPDMAFTPDAEYPVITTEKGIAQFTLTTSLDEGDYQLYINGGMRPNMVPDRATATVIGNIDRLYPILTEYDVRKNGLSFSAKGNTLTIEAAGTSAHASTPEKGKNALFALFRFLSALNLGGSQGKFTEEMLTLFIDKSDGSGAGLLLSDEVSGALTLNLGICCIGKNELFSDMQDDSCRVVLDIRYPVSYPLEEISAKLQRAIPSSWDCEIEHAQAPHHIDENTPLVQTLMKVYRQYTQKNDKPLAIGGGTYARALPGRAVAFGVQFPQEPDQAHQANEKIKTDNLLLSAKMFASALTELIQI